VGAVPLAHCDANSSNANAGFALGQIDADVNRYPYVVSDQLKRLAPQEFDHGIIDSIYANIQILECIKTFPPRKVTSDRYSSVPRVGSRGAAPLDCGSRQEYAGEQPPQPTI
jgi:hypothetical protein